MERLEEALTKTILSWELFSYLTGGRSSLAEGIKHGRRHFKTAVLGTVDQDYTLPMNWGGGGRRIALRALKCAKETYV